MAASALTEIFADYQGGYDGYGGGRGNYNPGLQSIASAPAHTSGYGMPFSEPSAFVSSAGVLQVRRICNFDMCMLFPTPITPPFGLRPCHTSLQMCVLQRKVASARRRSGNLGVTALAGNVSGSLSLSCRRCCRCPRRPATRRPSTATAHSSR